MTMRLNLRVSGTAEELLKEMSEQLDVSPKEVILDALGLYHLAISEIADGNLVGVRDGKSEDFMAFVTPSLRRWAEKFAKAAKEDEFAA